MELCDSRLASLMATRTKLEELYSIAHGGYTTGSEWVDGILIGLATWMFIRSFEFTVLDLLTFFYGNRKHRTGYLVLRTWQILNICHFYKLFTGIDSDLRFKHFWKERPEKGLDRKASSRVRVKKGKFRPILVSSVVLAKVLVLVAEVAIIAFVIPVATVHKSNGGLSIRWRNATVTKASLSELSTCEQLLTSDRFSETAQLVLCKRVKVIDSSLSIPQKWIPNGSLRFELIDATPENLRPAGAASGGFSWNCTGTDQDTTFNGVRMHSQSAARQTSSGTEPNVFLSNDVGRGELIISGESQRVADTQFQDASAAVLPIFSDVRRTLRLSFADMLDSRDPIDGRLKALTLNGKLMLGDIGGTDPSVSKLVVCRDVVNEIIRVTGTLHPELIIDILISGMTAVADRNFIQPTDGSARLLTTAGFEIGTSRKFRIPPEWMILAAGLAILASAFTSRLNKTEASMARVYREHNNMYSACAPSYLEEEVVEAALFKRGNEYHWGEDPGKGWDQVSCFDHAEEGTIV